MDRLVRPPRGSALLVALIFVMIASATMLAIIEYSSSNARASDRSAARESAFFSGTGALNLVINDLWGDYLTYSKTGDPNFRQYIVDPGKGQYGWAGLVDGQSVEPANWNGLRFGQARVTRVKITRNDEDLIAGKVYNTNLTVDLEVTGDRGGADEEVEKVWVSRTISATNKDNYRGFDFALLTKNISCSMCHMKIQRLDKAHNTDPLMYGKYERVKVGTLEMLALRVKPNQGGDDGTGPATLIEGTFYQRGILHREKSGETLDVDDLNSSPSLVTTEFNPNQTSIKQVDSSGTLNAGPYVQLKDYDSRGINPETGVPYPKENLYVDYPTDSADMQAADGELPTEFPAPFKDYYDAAGGPNPVENRKVDTQEVGDMMADDASNGQLGTLTADYSILVPHGSMWNSDEMPAAGTGASLIMDQKTTPTPHSGNVVLVGTASNPIKIDGKVVIQGDVIISGVVEGEGQIWATGNVYVPGDLQYNNKTDPTTGDEIFGTSPSDKNNLMGLVAGGSIIVGDYLSTVTHWNSGKGSFYEYGQVERGQRVTSDDATPFNPNDPRKYARPYYENNGGKDLGAIYEDDVGWDVDGDGDVDTEHVNSKRLSKVNFANFVVEELAMFNRDEITRVMEKVPTGAPQNKWWKGNDHIINSANYNLDNPVYAQYNDPASGSYYTPRIYTLYPDTTQDWGNQNYLKNTPAPIYLNDKNQFITGKNYWNATKDPHTYNALRTIDQIPHKNATSMAKAVTKSIHPEWITPGNMLSLIIKEEAKRTDNTPRRMDGLLYTNNAIFAIERKQSQTPINGTFWDVAAQEWKKPGGGTPEFQKVNSKSRGKMVVNGAMVAPDLGILVTGGTSTSSSPLKYYAPVRNKDGSVVYEMRAFNVNYDSRVRYLLDVHNSQQVIWTQRRKGWARGYGAMP